MPNQDAVAPSQEISGTVGEDVFAVHKLTDGKPVCGADGKVTEWLRAANCRECLGDGAE